MGVPERAGPGEPATGGTGAIGVPSEEAPSAPDATPDWASSSRRARTDARIPRIMIGRNADAATRASSDPVTFTQLGVGANHRIRPPLIATSRKPPPALNQRCPARTTLGPPPSTDGSRYDNAPVSNCTPNPDASAAAGQMKSRRTVAQSRETTSTQPAQTSPMTSHTRETPTDAGANSDSGRARRGLTRPRPQMTSPTR